MLRKEAISKEENELIATLNKKVYKSIKSVSFQTEYKNNDKVLNDMNNNVKPMINSISLRPSPLPHHPTIPHASIPSTSNRFQKKQIFSAWRKRTDISVLNYKEMVQEIKSNLNYNRKQLILHHWKSLCRGIWYRREVVMRLFFSRLRDSLQLSYDSMLIHQTASNHYINLNLKKCISRLISNIHQSKVNKYVNMINCMWKRFKLRMVGYRNRKNLMTKIMKHATKSSRTIALKTALHRYIAIISSRNTFKSISNQNVTNSIMSQYKVSRMFNQWHKHYKRHRRLQKLSIYVRKYIITEKLIVSSYFNHWMAKYFSNRLYKKKLAAIDNKRDESLRALYQAEINDKTLKLQELSLNSYEVLKSNLDQLEIQFEDKSNLLNELKRQVEEKQAYKETLLQNINELTDKLSEARIQRESVRPLEVKLDEIFQQAEIQRKQYENDKMNEINKLQSEINDMKLQVISMEDKIQQLQQQLNHEQKISEEQCELVDKVYDQVIQVDEEYTKISEEIKLKQEFEQYELQQEKNATVERIEYYKNEINSNKNLEMIENKRNQIRKLTATVYVLTVETG